ncbi:MAG TPA: protein kinase [Nannocystaceae bacterium]|nr:protein kinase [Nannocystaceae bacterium]
MSRSAAPLGDDLTPPGGMNLPGSRLRILDRISDGGCGVVYRGEHVDLQRTVAIKVSRSDALTAGARELFLDEARTTTRIESPYVVQVVDFGELPDGRVWYAMEHLGGRALDQIIASEGHIAPARAIALLRMACKGLAAAHAAGVVHRDVKPQNLVAIARGGREHLVLVDFGIALPCGTRPAVVSGTPEYMAREQILRDVLDQRTDVYGLGCCAYEMLTGLPIVAGCTVQQALLMHSEGIDPEFPEALGVPLALQEIVRRCLAIDPAQRYADMAELEAALCEAQIAARLPQVREDLELPPVDATRRRRIADGFLALARPQRRLPTRAAIFSSSLIAAVLGLVIAWPQQPSAAEIVPPMPAAAVSTIAIERAAPVEVLAPMTAVTEAPSEPVLASTTNLAAVAPAPAIRPAKVEPAAAPVVEAPRVVVPREPIARDAVKDGRRALRRGDRVVAEQAFRRAMQLDPRSSSAVAGLADVYFERGEHDRAMHFAKIAVQRAPQSSAHRVRLGDAYYRLARYADARAEYETAKRMGSAVARRRVAAMERSTP